jgi:hypothetical protein
MAEQDARTSNIRQSFEEWLAIAGWAVLFLIGPAVPQALDRLNAEAEFRAMYEGPVYFADHAAYSLEIYNNGRSARHGVEVWVPLPPGGDVSLEPGPYQVTQALRPEVGDRDGYRVFALGDLQPGQSHALSVAVSWKPSADPERRYADIPWIMARVVSGGARAEPLAWRFRAYRSEASQRWYASAFNLMSAAVVLLAILYSKSATQPQEPRKATPAPKEAWRRPAPRLASGL